MGVGGCGYRERRGRRPRAGRRPGRRRTRFGEAGRAWHPERALPAPHTTRGSRMVTGAQATDQRRSRARAMQGCAALLRHWSATTTTAAPETGLALRRGSDWALAVDAAARGGARALRRAADAERQREADALALRVRRG